MTELSSIKLVGGRILVLVVLFWTSTRRRPKELETTRFRLTLPHYRPFRVRFEAERRKGAVAEAVRMFA